MRTLAASEFKSKCLSILDEVAETGEPITISKRGKPVAQLFPAISRGKISPQESLRGTVEIIGDIVEPTTDPDDWTAERGKLL